MNATLMTPPDLDRQLVEGQPDRLEIGVTRLLVADSHEEVLQSVSLALDGREIDVVQAESPESVLEHVNQSRLDAVLMDVDLPQAAGLELLRAIHQIDRKLPVIVMTAGGDSDLAIDAMMSGAYDYVLKPVDVDTIAALVQQAIETRRLMQVPVGIPNGRAPSNEGDVLVGRSACMLEAYKAIGRVADEDVTVLIGGESGTGKELIARAIYQHSDRADRPFLAVNCAALSETLLESELFGHEKGAFTGAENRRIGKFEQCHLGTIFLDEVGDMSPSVQSKVLRLLQEQRFERVGGNTTIETDVRIVAATNRNLEQMVEEGEFRSDLYFRLNGFEIHLPPLRERGDDIILLLEHFLARFAGQMERQEVDGISPAAVELLREYSWPGNVRELQSVVKQALLKTSGPVIVPASLPAEIREMRGKQPAANQAGIDTSGCDLRPLVDQQIGSNEGSLYDSALEMTERYLLVRVLKMTGGNQSEAARRLGITRGSLRNKIRQRRISLDQLISLDE